MDLPLGAKYTNMPAPFHVFKRSNPLMIVQIVARVLQSSGVVDAIRRNKLVVRIDMVITPAKDGRLVPPKGKKRKEYDPLDSLAQSPSAEISMLGLALKNLKERVESLERGNTELLDETMRIKKRIGRQLAGQHPKKRRKSMRYSCTLCSFKSSDNRKLQRHRREAHKAPYNI